MPNRTLIEEILSSEHSVLAGIDSAWPALVPACVHQLERLFPALEKCNPLARRGCWLTGGTLP
jgi:hypothetical protein